jgi:hypothetical protein
LGPLGTVAHPVASSAKATGTTTARRHVEVRFMT